MRNRMQDFMFGRNGGDQLNQFLSIAALILVVIDIFVNGSILLYIAIVLLIVVIFRALSRNTAQREVENDRFMSIISRFRRGGRQNDGGYGGQGGYGSYSSGGRGSRGGTRSRTSSRESSERRKAQRQDKKYYKYFNCPNCNQKVRVPKGKGKIEITCPKCKTSFIRKT